MFYSRMRQYDLESPAYIVDAYNHERVTYVPKGTTSCYIVLEDKTPQTTNDMDAYSSSLVGYTTDDRPKEGWRIGGRYVVRSVMRHRTSNVLYLQEVEDGA